MRIWLPAIRGRSGADVFTYRLAQALLRRGIEAQITWFSRSYEFFPMLLRAVMPPNGTNVIHANSWNAFVFKRQTIPLVVTEHLAVFDPLARAHKNVPQTVYHESLLRYFVKRSFRAASTITAVSQFTALGLQRSFAIESAQVIYNWVDTSTFIPDGNRARRPGPFRLLFVGNPTRRKGSDLFAPIMRSLGAEFELYFTTGQRQLSPRRIEPNMFAIGRFTNERDLIEVYQRCDALLFPSRFEGFPLVVLEAMACAKPVIAANVSSLAEVIQDGVSGTLCPSGNIDAFTTACRQLAEEPQMCERYGAAAREQVERYFSEEVIVPRYVELYQRLLSS
jgi:glycosyltransferase involved in cell wall biosynthesis